MHCHDTKDLQHYLVDEQSKTARCKGEGDHSKEDECGCDSRGSEVRGKRGAVNKRVKQRE